MKIEGWRYYNHAAIPSCAAHEEPDIEPIVSGAIWKLEGKPLLARWTTDFDIGHKTGWWYIIADAPFDISLLKAKRRYVINKGLRYFDVKEIRPAEHREALCDVQEAAFTAYPEKYRPVLDRQRFLADMDKANDQENTKFFGAFFKETGELCGYARLGVNDKCVDFYVLKTKPAFEKYEVNAAIVYGIMQEFEPMLQAGGYIVDGAKNINHETAFQEYLEKYFGFRKAYCTLHIRYRKGIGMLIKMLWPFKGFLKKFDGINAIHNINAVIAMEEIVRNAN